MKLLKDGNEGERTYLRNKSVVSKARVLELTYRVNRGNSSGKIQKINIVDEINNEDQQEMNMINNMRD
ncbi:hypothetical protein RclHR1_12700006 [Rhizophagus clarus]|uniref:Uncharacterized protein n=1 Tax=Rhizophagus clarus TaxID=94130 RepID=A0A2Z6R0B8_9GLOM|nr:hypothetical protein RclHR1_12700006 [Rhizophagus clarus]